MINQCKELFQIHVPQKNIGIENYVLFFVWLDNAVHQ